MLKRAGIAAAIEERLPELRSDSTEGELFAASQSLAHTLAFKAELVKELDPPDGCEEVQEGGRREVGSIAETSRRLLMDMTPYLLSKLPDLYEESVAELRELQRKAATCE